MSIADLPVETEAIVLKVLETRVADAKTASRVPLEPLYPNNGDKRVIRAPLPTGGDAELASVYRTNPKAAWSITNRRALAEHLGDDPANVEYVDEITSEAAAIEVLREHAPELLARVERVKASAFTAALASAPKLSQAADAELTELVREEVAAAGGLPASGPSERARELAEKRRSPLPGIEHCAARGVLTVKPVATAGAAIEQLVAAKWITFDGRPLEVPAAAGHIADVVVAGELSS